MASTVPPCASVHFAKGRGGSTRPEKASHPATVVLVNETTEHVTAREAKRWGGGGGSVARQRHGEVESSVWATFVVVLDLLAENRREVTTAEHEHPVEAFGSDHPDPAFREGVGPRGSDGGLEHSGALGCEHLVEAGGKLGTPIPDEELDGPDSSRGVHRRGSEPPG